MARSLRCCTESLKGTRLEKITMEASYMRKFLSAIALITIAAPAFADEVTGVVLAFDRVDHIIVLDDKTVWTFPADFALPENLLAGDNIRIEFQGAAENGIGKILSVTRSES